MENVTKKFMAMREQQRIRIANMFGYDSPEDYVNKAEDNDIEKSDILDAISYGDSAFKFKKSGKEIKDQINNITLPKKNSELAIQKANAVALLNKCGAAPAESVCKYWTHGLDIDCDFKMYLWEECRMKPDYCKSNISSCIEWQNKDDNNDLNYAENEEQCHCRNKYNDTVNIICNILVDISTCNILLNNIDDSDDINLNVRQLSALCFK
jgi:hypothetical protein